MAGDTRESERLRMVDYQIAARDVNDERVLSAMREIPRHLFVPEPYRSAAYQDSPLPIGQGQTISQPYIVAKMTELLAVSPEDTVLEIGTGSGYQAAILGKLAREVITLERIPEVAEMAMKNLESLGISNVRVVVTDGTEGYPEKAPYNAILVTASTPEVPRPLMDQLAEEGAWWHRWESGTSRNWSGWSAKAGISSGNLMAEWYLCRSWENMDGNYERKMVRCHQGPLTRSGGLSGRLYPPFLPGGQG